MHFVACRSGQAFRGISVAEQFSAGPVEPIVAVSKMPAWWCGATDREPVDHAALTPCTAETASSPVMWIVAAAVLYTQIKRIQLLKRHRSYLSPSQYGVRQAFVSAALVALTVSHIGWLAFYIWQHQAAFHYLYESTMVVYWLAALVGQPETHQF